MSILPINNRNIQPTSGLTLPPEQTALQTLHSLIAHILSSLESFSSSARSMLNTSREPINLEIYPRSRRAITRSRISEIYPHRASLFP